jgi:hypothetical protein
MKLAEVQRRARQMGINPNGKTKTDIVRSIQRGEHNRDCFNRGESGTCGQTACAWRADCK